MGVCVRQRRRRELVIGKFDMARSLLIILVLTLIVSFSEAGLLSKRSAMSDGDAESIHAFYGFYGSPIYRPYGFGSWGYGSAGFGLHPTYVASPNIYGGYMY